MKISFMHAYNTHLKVFVRDTSGMRRYLIQKLQPTEVCVPVRGMWGKSRVRCKIIAWEVA